MLHALLDVQHFSELRRRPAPPADGKLGKCAMVAWPSSLFPSQKLEVAHEQKQVALLDGVLYSLLRALDRKLELLRSVMSGDGIWIMITRSTQL